MHLIFYVFQEPKFSSLASSFHRFMQDLSYLIYIHTSMFVYISFRILIFFSCFFFPSPLSLQKEFFLFFFTFFSLRSIAFLRLTLWVQFTFRSLPHRMLSDLQRFLGWIFSFWGWFQFFSFLHDFLDPLNSSKELGARNSSARNWCLFFYIEVIWSLFCFLSSI